MARLDEGLKWYERILAPRLNTIDGQIANLADTIDHLSGRLDDQVTGIRREMDLSRNEVVARVDGLGKQVDGLGKHIEAMHNEMRAYFESLRSQIQLLVHQRDQGYDLDR